MTCSACITEDKIAGGFFLTGADQEKLLARDKPSYDGAEPSGNSVALLDLLRLYELTTNETYKERADRAVKAFGKTLQSSPTSLSEMLLALDFMADVPKEIVIVTPTRRADAAPLLAKLREVFVPNAVLVVVSEGDSLATTESSPSSSPRRSRRPVRRPPTCARSRPASSPRPTPRSSRACCASGLSIVPERGTPAAVDARGIPHDQ